MTQETLIVVNLPRVVWLKSPKILLRTQRNGVPKYVPQDALIEAGQRPIENP